MSHSHDHDRTLPRGALFGAAGLVLFTLVAVSVARLTGLSAGEPPAADVTQSRELRFEDRADGAVAVYAAKDDQLVQVLVSGEGGFVRGVLRGLARERRASDIGSQPPFGLTRWSNGLLSLEDPETGRRVDLNAFGATNAGAFARFLGNDATGGAS